MKKLVLIMAVSLFASQVFGASPIKPEPTVTDLNQNYKTVLVQMNGVYGVSVTLEGEVERTDCNARSLNMNEALVSGNGNGFYDKYLLNTHIIATQIYCPLDEPVLEKIKSNSVFFASFGAGRNNHEMILELVVPEQFDVLVTPIDARAF